MKKHFSNLAFVFVVILALIAFGCSTDAGDSTSEEKTDTSSQSTYTVRSVTATSTSSLVVLAWIKPSDTSNYGGVEISWGSKSAIVDANTTTYTVTGLSAETQYTFTLRTLNSSGKETDSSVSLTVTTPAAQNEENDTIAPNDVADLSATNLDGAVLLTWTDPTDSDLFGIQITYTENTSSRSALAAMEEGSIFVAPKTQSAEITNLANGTSYTFTVKAMDTSGNKSSGKTTTITPTAIQGNAMQITLTPSTTETTSDNISVSVAITTDARFVTIVKYASGERNVSYFVSGGTAISADDNRAYSFSASENGTYTVYVFDSDGRREVQTIIISNIDKTAPQAVSNLYASYDNSTKKITVAWSTNDTDIDHYLVSYSVDDEARATDEIVTTLAYTLENVEQNSGTYTFTVKAVDKAGNKGAEISASITPITAPYVSKITLDRSHIAYNTENKTINVTVHGGNFNLILSTSDDPTLKVQLVSTDGTTVYDTQTATVDTSTNTATAAITVPTLTSSSRDGTDYVVRAKVCGEVDSNHTATLNISNPASIYEISLSTKQISVSDVTSTTTTTATITGYNFDAHSNIILQLYDSTNVSYADAVVIDMDAIGKQKYSTGWTSGGLTVITGSTTMDKITADIVVPTVDDMYTLKVFFDGNINSKTATLQVYGVPTFTSFRIPNAGTSKEDSTVTAMVKGKNFTAPNITASSFTVACAAKSSIASGAVVTVQDDSTLKIALNIPGTAGEYAVTILSGSESYEGTFTVKDTSAYKVGQIVLADGTCVDPSSYTAINNANPPVAVVAMFNDYGVALGVGLYTSSSSLQWAPIGTTGYSTDIVCTPSDYGSGKASTATFTGDIDGSNNWNVICSVDPNGSVDVATNYPAFNWANSYGETYKDYLGIATEGWYIPSLAELCYVYRNHETINATLAVINGINSSYAQSSLGTNDFWSSSQRSSIVDDAWFVSVSSNFMSYEHKNNTNYVLVVRAF